MNKMSETKSDRNRALPPLPWKTRLSIFLLSALTDRARRPDGTINRRLVRFFDFQSPPNPNPVNSVSSSDTNVDPSRDLWFRLFSPTARPSSDRPLPVVVFFHGGGFTYLSPASQVYDAVCRRFARKMPAFVVSVNYRLSPEHRYPAPYDDGFDVLRFFDDNDVLPPNANLSKCFLAGDSAGGNLAHHIAVRATMSKFRALKVVGLVCIQPFFGGQARTESEARLIGSAIVSVARSDWCWRAFLPDGSDRDHEASNVSGPNAVDISGLDFPETLVIVGGYDPLQDWQRRYYEWLRKSGKDAKLIEYPNSIHAFYVFPELPESGQVIAELKDFVAKQLSKL